MPRAKTEVGVHDTAEAPAAIAGVNRLRLVIIDGDLFRTQVLPSAGAITLGRSSKCEIVIDNDSISRHHARIVLGEVMTVEDLGSANGTSVGDTAVAPGQATPFGIGEAVSLGSVTVLVQKSTAQARPKRIWPHGYFEGRVEEECLRSERMRAEFAVVRLIGEREGNLERLEDALASAVRGIDVLGRYAPGDYEVLLTDCARATAESIVARLLEQLAAREIEMRAGIACYPADARTADALIARAGTHHAPEVAHAIVESGIGHLEALTRKVAASSISVLVLGETGAGKEVLASTIHRLSPRANQPFLALNCASLSESLLESELFGHERGAFTGAVAAKPGLLETADGGTVFLDEVGDLPLPTQVKLLRVLEDRLVMRVGAVKSRPIDVRFVSATNRDLEGDIRRGTFRRDLYFRLNGITLEVPPLRERRGEIEQLALLFAGESARGLGLAAQPVLSSRARALLLEYSWPGNVRELRNVMERAVVLSAGAPIDLEHLPVEKMRATLGAHDHGWERHPTPAPVRPPTPLPVPSTPPARSSGDLRDEIEALEKARILEAMERCGGNQKRAAIELGISRRTLVNRLDAYGIKRPRKST